MNKTFLHVLQTHPDDEAITMKLFVAAAAAMCGAIWLTKWNKSM